MARQEKSDPALQVLNGNGAHASCWSCGDMVAAHFCNACGRVQPAVPTDYFSFFGLPRKLNIDAAALEREMFMLSRRLHPDLYANASDREQSWSLEQTSQLNDAFRTLRDHFTRTEYLLRLEGFKSHEQSLAATEAARASGGQKKPAVPPDLLEEVFALNMQLEELQMNRKAGEEDYALTCEIKQVQAKFEHSLKIIADNLHALWDRWDALIDRAEAGEPVSADDRRALCTGMLDLLNRRRYVQHVVRDINDALND